MSIQNFIEKMQFYGTDISDALERFLDDTELYEECLLSFIDEESFKSLDDALAEKNYQLAFTISHSLKGVSGNLGLTPLFSAICTFVEALRRDDYSQLQQQYRQIVLQRDNIKRMIES